MGSCICSEPSRNEKEHAMPGEDNAALVAKFLDELWNQQNLASIDQLTIEDYVVHIPQGDLLGREALKIVAKDYIERFSQLIRDFVLLIRKKSEPLASIR